MGIIVALIVGGVAGWLAGLVMKGASQGVVMNVIIGLVGGAIGGWLFVKTEQKKLRQMGRILMGIAFILISLRFLREAMDPIRDSAFLPAISNYLAQDYVTAFIVGATLAFVMHSSVAAILMCVTLVQIGALPFVTHCYERPRSLPEWPYNLFAMVHGDSRDEVDRKRAAIAEILGDALRGSDILISTRILKKTGMRLTKRG